MVFSKEVFLNAISTMNDLQVMQYITQQYLLFSLILVFLIPIVVTIFLRLTMKDDSFWVIFAIASVIQLFLIILTILGFLPFFLTL